MTQHLVKQLYFARSEFLRAWDGVSAEDAIKRLMPMNCISWIIGHLANQENQYWVYLGQGKELAPGLRQQVGHGMPATTPDLDAMVSTWHMVTKEADLFLEALTPEKMETHFIRKGNPIPENIGTILMRITFHYWYHIGEIASIRQILGHQNLPEFVGDMTTLTYHQAE